MRGARKPLARSLDLVFYTHGEFGLAVCNLYGCRYPIADNAPSFFASLIWKKGGWGVVCGTWNSRNAWKCAAHASRVQYAAGSRALSSSPALTTRVCIDKCGVIVTYRFSVRGFAALKECRARILFPVPLFASLRSPGGLRGELNCKALRLRAEKEKQ